MTSPIPDLLAWTPLGTRLGYTTAQTQREEILDAISRIDWTEAPPSPSYLDVPPVSAVVGAALHGREQIRMAGTTHIAGGRLIGLQDGHGARTYLLDLGSEAISLLDEPRCNDALPVGPARTPTILRGDRCITYRWVTGRSAETWLDIPGTDLAELQVHHLAHSKQFSAWLHPVTLFANGATRCSYPLTGPSWSLREPVARFTTPRLDAFAERALQQLRATDETQLAFAFTASAGAA